MKKIAKVLIAAVVVFIVILTTNMDASAAKSGYWYYESYEGNDYSGVTITGYDGPGGDITIPDTLGGKPVVSIDENAFYYESNISSITISNSVKRIESGAIQGCQGLTRVNISSSVTLIDKDSIVGDYLGNIVVDAGNTVYTSLVGVLYNKSKTRLIKFPPNRNQRVYEIPDGVQEIDENAFSDAFYLTGIIIPNSVKKIGRRAFAFCDAIPTITIPKSVTSIGKEAFYSCKKLTAINVDIGSTVYSSLDGVLFNKDKSILLRYPEGNSQKSYKIPNSVRRINQEAFSYCENLTSITIPNGVKEIGIGAFESCTSLKRIAVPNSVTSISSGAFFACTALESITLSKNIKKIDNATFKECKSLKSITIPTNVDKINYAAFSGCTSLKSVTLPNGIKSIGDYAFQGCRVLGKLAISKNVKKIGESAFEGCKKLVIHCHKDARVYKYAKENSVKISLTSRAVTFKHGKSTLKTVNIDKNKKVKSYKPAKKGHKFEGWYADSKFTKKFMFSKKIIKNTTIYARFTKSAKSSKTENAVSKFVDINKENFPDRIFREHVKKYDKNKDGKLSSIEIGKVKTFDLNDMGISTLIGIEHFTKLTTLSCEYNSLKKLDLRKNKELKSLNCFANEIHTLNLQQNSKLEVLHCGGNRLKSLDLSKNKKLYELDCYRNKLSKLDLSKNKYLNYLRCDDNKLSELDVRKNTNLYQLSCSENKIEKLDLQKNKSLDYLSCGNNKIRRLDLSKNKKLEILNCDSGVIVTGWEEKDYD